MREPLVSIIVCTIDRADHMAECARSIMSNDYRFIQLTVVDQSDDSRTAKALDALREDRILYLPVTVRGKSKALNYAIPRVSGEIVAFTDDDCIIEPDWISTIVREFQNDPDLAAVFGRVKSLMCRPKQADNGYWIYYNWGVLDHPEREVFTKHTNVYRVGGLALGGNIACRRGFLDEVGPFDEDLGVGSPLAGGEDIDFIYRVLRSGAKAVYAPDAVVYHKQWKDPDILEDTLARYVRSDAAIMVKHLKRGDWYPFYGYLSARIFQQFLIPGLRNRDRWRLNEGAHRLVRLGRNLWFCQKWYQQNGNCRARQFDRGENRERSDS